MPRNYRSKKRSYKYKKSKSSLKGGFVRAGSMLSKKQFTGGFVRAGSMLSKKQFTGGFVRQGTRLSKKKLRRNLKKGGCACGLQRK